MGFAVVLIERLLRNLSINTTLIPKEPEKVILKKPFSLVKWKRGGKVHRPEL